MSTPTVRRRRLGVKLRALRDVLGLTLEEVAEKSNGGITTAKLSRLETARSAAKAPDVEFLLDLYGVDDSELRTALLALTREGARRGWWQSYKGVLSPAYEDLISLEAEATSVRTWQIGVIPGLLQTGEYARELMTSIGMSEAVETKVDALVEVRLARQAVLTRETPVNLWAIIAESALRTRCVGTGVMRDQLGRLLERGRRPNVTIQVLPSDSPPHVGQMGSYSVLGFEDYADLDVVHVESLTSALYVEDGGQVGVYRDAFERLRAAALSVELSAECIEQIREDH
ncbi:MULTISPECIES: helix-turn-helix domain-containing protein [Streptomyces]|uniref:helix-turn-helix domain-containing protein n=1 Tax=Streptomyces TaxID=1883 RepID=UPI00081DD0F0|nr:MULTISPECIES: helix-turn-helix transcriptional regulator [unclassified Streptomyces]MYQ92768.1 helix-turn-helix domain-containing protein [Streptomyces sp. SID4946]MYQ97208.1 helix-turn-helix domain-containing protein [Streptomyces sp. SID6139]MYR21560.1 helix-turn-helix domain-containing protein [Streptomyces sp. SID6137]MBJ7001477.1 helix-turn-helix domain-containing protein [Streptomyces sp. CRPSP2-6A1]TGZ17715.1 transcriptional regulator [Streptomyces sp. S816]